MNIVFYFYGMHSWRIILFPFSIIYMIVVWFRNFLYDVSFKKTYPIPGKSICIGNITVGGTGKSPLTSYLTKLLIEENPIILSRGYGRKTKGLIWASEKSTVAEIGDEPLMYWNHFAHKIPVVVSEKRILGVNSIRNSYPNAVILLDDAFQHRAVKAGLNILLMTFNRPVFNDFTFPTGNLRENRSGMKRADVVIVTKCPENLTNEQKQKFYSKLTQNQQDIFFSQIKYSALLPLFQTQEFDFEEAVLVTAIANPDPLYQHLKKQIKVTKMSYPDHHNFNEKDIQQIQQKVATFTQNKIAVITTEKDAVRFRDWEKEINSFQIPIFVQKMDIVIDRENEFINRIKAYVTATNERSC